MIHFCPQEIQAFLNLFPFIAMYYGEFKSQLSFYYKLIYSKFNKNYDKSNTE